MVKAEFPVLYQRSEVNVVCFQRFSYFNIETWHEQNPLDTFNSSPSRIPSISLIPSSRRPPHNFSRKNLSFFRCNFLAVIKLAQKKTAKNRIVNFYGVIVALLLIRYHTQYMCVHSGKDTWTCTTKFTYYIFIMCEKLCKHFSEHIRQIKTFNDSIHRELHRAVQEIDFDRIKQKNTLKFAFLWINYYIFLIFPAHRRKKN